MSRSAVLVPAFALFVSGAALAAPRPQATPSPLSSPSPSPSPTASPSPCPPAIVEEFGGYGAEEEPPVDATIDVPNGEPLQVAPDEWAQTWLWRVPNPSCLLTRVRINPPLDEERPYEWGIDFRPLTSGEGTAVLFDRPGVYVARLEYDTPSAQTLVLMVGAERGSVPLERLRSTALLRGAAGCPDVSRRRITVTIDRDAVILSGDTDRHLRNLSALLPGAPVAPTRAAGLQAVNNHTATSLTLAGHGTNSAFKFVDANEQEWLRPGERVTAFRTGLNRNIERLNFFSCCSADNDGPNELLRDLVPEGSRIRVACGSTTPVYTAGRPVTQGGPDGPILELRDLHMEINEDSWLCRVRYDTCVIHATCQMFQGSPRCIYDHWTNVSCTRVENDCALLTRPGPPFHLGPACTHAQLGFVCNPLTTSRELFCNISEVPPDP